MISNDRIYDIHIEEFSTHRMEGYGHHYNHEEGAWHFAGTGGELVVSGLELLCFEWKALPSQETEAA